MSFETIVIEQGCLQWPFNYGCYCGANFYPEEGDIGLPMDTIDTICYDHDMCYIDAMVPEINCTLRDRIFAGYEWTRNETTNNVRRQ